jgi:hypothetical protein
MLNAEAKTLLDAVLDAWERINTVLLNLLRVLPKGGRGKGRNG